MSLQTDVNTGEPKFLYYTAILVMSLVSVDVFVGLPWQPFLWIIFVIFFLVSAF